MFRNSALTGMRASFQQDQRRHGPGRARGGLAVVHPSGCDSGREALATRLAGAPGRRDCGVANPDKGLPLAALCSLQSRVRETLKTGRLLGQGARLATLCLLAMASTAAVALESDREQPIELAADSVDINEGRGLSIYRGDVDLRQGSMRLRADVVTVHHRGRDPSRVVAEGRPVRFEQASKRGPVEGRARRVEYEIASENLELTGDAVLIQGQDTMRSDRIVYDRVHAVVKAGAAAEGKQRVRITIQPPAK